MSRSSGPPPSTADSTGVSVPPSPGFSRDVGLLGLTAIAVNGVIGSGIFVLPATVAALVGPASPAAYLVAALLTALVVLCFAEAGSLFEQTGGPYLYAREAFGGFVGFEVGWMFFLSRLAAGAAIANALTGYLGFLWPPAAHGTGRFAVIVLVFGALAAINVAGVRHGAAAVNTLTLAKLLPLLLFVGVGLGVADGSRYRLLAVPDLDPLRQASLLLVFAFGGFENASVPSEEVKNPRRNLPLALMAAILLTTVLYVLIQVVALGTLPGLATDPTPLASAGSLFLGPLGGLLITLGAVVSTAGSMSALILVGPRILYALAHGGQIPALLARIHAAYRTPHVAVLVFTALACALAVAGTFAQLVAVSVIARLVFSATTCLAVPVLRRRISGAPGGFAVPGGPLVPLVAAGVCLWLLGGLTPRQVRAGAVALLAGALLFLLGRRSDRER